MKRSTSQSDLSYNTAQQVRNSVLYLDLLERKKRGLMDTVIVVPLISEEIGLISVSIDQLLTLVKPKEEQRARPRRR